MASINVTISCVRVQAVQALSLDIDAIIAAELEDGTKSRMSAFRGLRTLLERTKKATELYQKFSLSDLHARGKARQIEKLKTSRPRYARYAGALDCFKTAEGVRLSSCIAEISFYLTRAFGDTECEAMTTPAGERSRVAMAIEPGMRKRLEEICARDGVTLSATLRSAIKEYIKKHKG